jgi:hypothetical protein
MSDNFFEYLKSIYSKADIEYKESECPPWLLLLWLSHDKDSFQYVEKINKYLFFIKPKYIWQYLKYKLPYNKNKFLKYTKKEQPIIDDDAINELCITYNISKHEAKQLLFQCNQ